MVARGLEEIRPLTPADYDGVTSFLHAHLPAYDPGVSVRTLLNSSGVHIYGVYAAQTLSSAPVLGGLIILRAIPIPSSGMIPDANVATVGHEPPRHRIHVHALAVDPAYRHQRLATSLYQYAMADVLNCLEPHPSGASDNFSKSSEHKAIKVVIRAEGKEGNGSREFWQSVGLVVESRRGTCRSEWTGEGRLRLDICAGSG